MSFEQRDSSTFDGFYRNLQQYGDAFLNEQLSQLQASKGERGESLDLVKKMEHLVTNAIASDFTTIQDSSILAEKIVSWKKKLKDVEQKLTSASFQSPEKTEKVVFNLLSILEDAIEQSQDDFIKYIGHRILHDQPIEDTTACKKLFNTLKSEKKDIAIKIKDLEKNENLSPIAKGLLSRMALINTKILAKPAQVETKTQIKEMLEDELQKATSVQNELNMFYAEAESGQKEIPQLLEEIHASIDSIKNDISAVKNTFSLDWETYHELEKLESIQKTLLNFQEILPSQNMQDPKYLDNDLLERLKASIILQKRYIATHEKILRDTISSQAEKPSFFHDPARSAFQKLTSELENIESIFQETSQERNLKISALHTLQEQVLSAESLTSVSFDSFYAEYELFQKATHAVQHHLSELVKTLVLLQNPYKDALNDISSSIQHELNKLLISIKQNALISHQEAHNIHSYLEEKNEHLKEIEQKLHTLQLSLEEGKRDVFCTALEDSMGISLPHEGSFSEIEEQVFHILAGEIEGESGSIEELSYLQSIIKKLFPYFEDKTQVQLLKDMLHSKRVLLEGKEARESTLTTIEDMLEKTDREEFSLFKTAVQIIRAANFEIPLNDLVKAEHLIKMLSSSKDEEISARTLADIYWLLGEKITAIELYKSENEMLSHEQKARIPEGLLQEKLDTITALVQENNAIDPLVKISLINFACKEIEKAKRKEGSKEETASGTPLLLGKMLTIIDKSPYSFSTEIAITEDFIYTQFDALLFEKKARIQEIWQESIRLPLGRSSEIAEQRIAYEIADLLLTQDGTCNAIIAQDIKKTLLVSKGARSSFDNHIAHVLNELTYSHEATDVLKKIEAPLQEITAGNLMVRACVGKGPHEALTHRDAKLAALSAGLLHWRQGSIGSCFATSYIIQNMSNSFKRSLEHFGEIIETGKLERRVRGKDYAFIPILKAIEYTLDKEILANPEDNSIIQVNDEDIVSPQYAKDLIFLHESFSIQRVCTELEIADPQEACSRAIFSLQTEGKLVSPRSIIDTLVEQQYPKLTGEEKSSIVNAAYFVYEAQGQHPVTRCTENALASMSRSPDAIVEGHRTHDRYIEEVQVALYTALKNVGLLQNEMIELQDAYAEFGNVFDDAVEFLVNTMATERIRYFYDPSVPHGNEKRAAFIMHLQNPDGSYKRVDTPDDFAVLIQELIEESSMRIESLSTEEDATPQLKMIAACSREIANNLADPHLLKSILVDANREFLTRVNAEVIESPYETDWTTIPELLWRQEQGGYTNVIYQVDWSEKLDIHLPKQEVNLSVRFDELIQIGTEYQELGFVNPEYRVPVKGLAHSFSFLPLHPSFPKGLKDVNERHDAIQKIIETGKAYSNIQMTPQIQEECRFFLMDLLFKPEEIQENFEGAPGSFDTLSLEKEFIQVEENFAPDPETPLTIHEYLEKAIETICLIRGYPLTEHEAETVENYAVSHLCPDCKNSFVVFADSNWEEKMPQAEQGISTIEHVNLGFYISPITHELNVARISESGAFIGVANKNFAFFEIGKIGKGLSSIHVRHAEGIQQAKKELRTSKKLEALEKVYVQKRDELTMQIDEIAKHEDLYVKAKSTLKDSQNTSDTLPAELAIQEASKRNVKLQALSEKISNHLSKLTRASTEATLHGGEYRESLELIASARDALRILKKFKNETHLTDWIQSCETFMHCQNEKLDEILIKNSVNALKYAHDEEYLRFINNVLLESFDKNVDVAPIPITLSNKDRNTVADIFTNVESKTI